MKHILIFLAFISFGVSAQTWQTIPSAHYNFSKYTSGDVVSINYSQFEINPYDGTMWFISNNYGVDFNIKRINSDGSMTLFDPTNTSFMDMNSRYYYGMDFTSSRTYLLHGFQGVFSYDGSFWNQPVGTINKGVAICADGDSAFVSRLDANFLTIKDDVPFFYPWNYAKRMASRNGSTWATYGTVDGIYKYDWTASDAIYFTPESSPLLDYSNHDFKFARTSDTLYVAGEQGFSLAFGDVFEDTITMNTCSNMPYPSILEFEFDSQDNIWAVFGDGGTQGFLPMYIGYYDRDVQDWTLVYDQSTSPIDFSQKLDIEIDNDDNLWVCDRFNLHVLKINTTPGWLSLVDESIQSFSIYPNPTNGAISIQTDQAVSDIEIRDLSGRLIKSLPFASEIYLESKGTYSIRLLDNGIVVGNQIVMVE